MLEVKAKAATRMPPRPTHVIRAAMSGGSFANWRLATATSAPSASSQARVKGEKKAATPLVEVWWIDQANDTTMLQTKRTDNFGRMLMRFQLNAARMKSVG